MKKIIFIILGIALVATLGFTTFTIVKAETSGGSPESGATSRIKTIYDHLKDDLSYGSDAAGAWGDWGAYWNRIRSASEWVPAGDAEVTDVKNGSTFYNTTRTEQTGTYPNPSSCSTQQYHDSYGAPVTQTTNCTDTLTWTTADPAVTGDDTDANTDPRTGLIWSNCIINSGGVPTFAATCGTNWSWDGTTDADSVAVGSKTAAQLCSERGNGWRLPTQKELMQSYIDGSNFNLTNPANYFWSLTEASATSAWFVLLSLGYTASYDKAPLSRYVRCVR